MTDIVIGNLAEEPVAKPSWDSVWVGDEATLGGWADWVVGESGDLKADSPVETAIILCLFTDARLPDEMTPEGSHDRRGWHGDTFDLDPDAGERPMGSLLWTLDRAVLTFETERRAEHYARTALQTLIDQGVVGRFDIETESDKLHGMLKLHVVAIGPDSRQLFDRTFQRAPSL